MSRLRQDRATSCRIQSLQTNAGPLLVLSCCHWYGPGTRFRPQAHCCPCNRGTAHFSIVQSGIENYQVIKAIHYFIKGPNTLNHQIKPENSKVYRISFSSKKDLNFIIKIFDNNLLGLKKLQFNHWKSYIISKTKNSASNIILPKVSNNNNNNNNNNYKNNNNYNNNNESRFK